MKIKRLIDFLKLLTSKDEEKNENDGFILLTRIARNILPGYRFTFPQIGWWRDDDFNSYLSKFSELDGFNSQRRWALKQFLRMTAAVNGDTAECGAYRGASSWLMLHANKDARCSNQKMHHIFDSFEGLSSPNKNDGTHWKQGDLAAETQIVEACLTPFLHGIDYKMYKGWIPERFSEVGNILFSFVHIDVDLFQPTHDSISFFYPRLNKGAILLCDDYGFLTCPGATKAIDDYLFDKKEKMLSLPDGGGFFIKGMSVH